MQKILINKCLELELLVKNLEKIDIFFGLMSTIVLFHTEIIQFQAADSSLRDDSAG